MKTKKPFKTTKNLKVVVTQKDIAKATEQKNAPDCNALKDCIVATALRRQTGSNGWVVGFNYASHTGADYELPTQAREAVRRWCTRQTVKPFTFTMTRL